MFRTPKPFLMYGNQPATAYQALANNATTMPTMPNPAASQGAGSGEQGANGDEFNPLGMLRKTAYGKLTDSMVGSSPVEQAFQKYNPFNSAQGQSSVALPATNDTPWLNQPQQTNSLQQLLAMFGGFGGMGGSGRM